MSQSTNRLHNRPRLLRALHKLLGCSLLAACGGAQQIPLPAPYNLESKTDADWKKPPASMESELTLPPLPVVSFELESGLRVGVVERPDSKVTSIRLWVPEAGGDSLGPVSVMVDALQAGSRLTDDSVVVNPRLSRRGISAWTSPHGSNFSWTVLARASKPAIRLLSAFATRPAFLEDETHERIRESLNRLQRYSVSHKYREDLARDSMPGIKYEKTDALAKMMLGLSPRKMAKIHGCRMKPQGAVLVVSGAVQASEVETWVNKYFGAWKGINDDACSAYSKPVALAEQALERPEVFFVPTWSPEPYLTFMYPGPAVADPDFVAFSLVAHAMALKSKDGIASSLRHSGSTYGINAKINANFVGQSMLEISGAVRPSGASQSLRKIVESLKEFSSTVKDEDIALAKRQVRTSTVSFAGSTSGITRTLLFQMRRGDAPQDAGNSLRQILATTPEQCRAVARKWTDGVNPVILALAPPDLNISHGIKIGAKLHTLTSRDVK